MRIIRYYYPFCSKRIINRLSRTRVSVSACGARGRIPNPRVPLSWKCRRDRFPVNIFNFSTPRVHRGTGMASAISCTGDYHACVPQRTYAIFKKRKCFYGSSREHNALTGRNEVTFSIKNIYNKTFLTRCIFFFF
jgi:hypothetical protein